MTSIENCKKKVKARAIENLGKAWYSYTEKLERSIRGKGRQGY